MIEIGSYWTRSIDSLPESFTPPTHGVRTRVGRTPAGKYTVGDEIGPDDVIVDPVQRGAVVDWTALEALLQHVLYKQLDRPWPPEASQLRYAVGLIVPPEWSDGDREIVARMFFEDFLVGGLCIFESPLLSLLALNLTSGVVVDVGYEMTGRRHVAVDANHIPRHYAGAGRRCCARRPGVASVRGAGDHRLLAETFAPRSTKEGQLGSPAVRADHPGAG